MKIAFFDDRYFELYGAQENTLLCAELARQLGHEVLVYTTYDGPLAEAARRRELPVTIVSAPASIRVFEKKAIRGGVGPFIRATVGAARYSLSLHDQVLADRVDLLVTAAVRPALLAARTRLARRTKVMLYAQNSTPFGSFAAAALPGVSLVALIADDARTTFPWWAWRLFRPRTTLLESGRDLTRFQPTERVPGPTLRLLTICSITERKGIHVVLDAMRQARDAGVETMLTVVGSTNSSSSEAYKHQLVRQVEEDGLDVHWAGWTSDVVPYLQAADLFVLGSSHEGLPGVLIEAAASGLPAITTAAGGCARAVEDGVSGAVVPVGDAAAMARAVVRFREDDLRATAESAARALAEREFALGAFSGRLDEACRLAVAP